VDAVKLERERGLLGKMTRRLNTLTGDFQAAAEQASRWASRKQVYQPVSSARSARRRTAMWRTVPCSSLVHQCRSTVQRTRLVAWHQQVTMLRKLHKSFGAVQRMGMLAFNVLPEGVAA